MAQRFGGEYSPGTPGQSPFRGKSPSRAAGRANFLFLAPFPLLVSAFLSGPLGLATDLAAFALLILAAWLTREGLKAEDAYHARKIARRPAMPRKIFASVLTGAGLYAAGFSGDLFTPLIFAVLGLGLHSFAFGLDPLKDKGMEGVDTFQQDRVARAVAEAEKHLQAMQEAILRTSDRQLLQRVEGFQNTARDMFRTVEDDPRDLTAARKYLVVYLQGARDATLKFADLYSRNADTGARADFEALLDDLERNFADRTSKLLLDDRADLDVEIEVLRERLQREGVPMARDSGV